MYVTIGYGMALIVFWGNKVARDLRKNKLFEPVA
jgi:hypothetical protein